MAKEAPHNNLRNIIGNPHRLRKVIIIQVMQLIQLHIGSSAN